MRENRNINSIPRTILKVFLTFNIVGVLVCIAILLLSIDTYGVFASSIGVITALANSIGLTLLIRWRYIGFYIMLPVGIISTILLMVTCAGWLDNLVGVVGLALPFFGFLIYITTLFVLLHVKTKGRTLWSQMMPGFDWLHFRHIYQSSLVIVVLVIVGTYYLMPQTTEVIHDQENESDVLDVPLSRLDAADITIEEVVSFEKVYNETNQVNERDEKIVKRIGALKHLLLGELMIDIHSRDNFVNICMIHAYAFSEEQKDIINWFTALEISQQYKWNVCEKVVNLKDFKTVVQNKISE